MKNGKFRTGQCKKECAAGYCHCKTHLGYISEKQLKTYKCVAKHCNYLERYEDHPYWIRRAEIQELKRQKKEQDKLTA